MQLFYDNFTHEDIAGLFSVWHYLFIFLFALLLAVSLYLSKSVSEKQLDRILFWVAASVSVVEIFKITIRVAKGSGVDSWIPLYYCSLFIYAIWMIRCKVSWVSRMGYSFITMGGALAACLFTLYPTTSLAIFPPWHPATFHSFLYHLVMAYVGILVLWKKTFVPEKRDSLLYCIYVLFACLVGYFINEWTGSNCMFLHNAFGLPFLNGLLSSSHALYILLVSLAQAVLMFWANFGVYTLIKRHKEKNNEKLRILN